MVKSGYIFAITLLLAISFSSVNAVLQCWRCSTDSTNGAFCTDPFNSGILSEQQIRWNYVNCSLPYGFDIGPNSNLRPVCKKLVQEIYGKTVVLRSCFWEDANDQPDKCYHNNFPLFVKTLYCRTCDTDGCNGATGYAPLTAIILIIPTLIAKLLSW